MSATAHLGRVSALPKPKPKDFEHRWRWRSWQSRRKLPQLHLGHRCFHRFLVKCTQDKVETGLILVLEQIYEPAIDDVVEAVVNRDAVPESFWKLQRYITKKRDELNFGFNPKGGGGEGVDLLTSYLNEDENMGVKFDNKFLRDTMLSFMAAARDTVSSALTWFLWLVSIQPVVEAKIRRLEESISKQIVFSIYAMGRMKFIWGEDCLEFKPERWITEQGEIKHEPSFKFFVFNAGPRACLGKNMALIQIKSVAAPIIHNSHVCVVVGHPVSPNVSIDLHMEHGLMVNITKRC
ncbi:hypothetical protein Vadar_012983 [Vaccinium darrowii]|uniref:Uncharacterized protein n=1 Tax=Vaccinium darrowii TaxID=229202 RepID=A0ACB7Z3C0_9ERIC|nr:hypothetical protein Vadar_012983 [Vaccinium darrowii]